MRNKLIQRFDIIFFIAVLTMILVLAWSARAQETSESQTRDASENQTQQNITARGGGFTLEKAVIAGGGSAKRGAAFIEHGTTGQSIAGIKSSGGQFSISAGFWIPENFAPTAGGVTTAGRVKTNAGKGIRNVTVTVTFPNGETRATVSGASGFYQFADIPAGATYIFSVSAKRYVFSQPTQVRNIIEDIEHIDFVADTPSLT